MSTRRRPVHRPASTVLAALADLTATGRVPNALVPGPAHATDALTATCLEGTR